ncbi:MAG: peptidase [Planctomycetota bacterium]
MILQLAPCALLFLMATSCSYIGLTGDAGEDGALDLEKRVACFAPVKIETDLSQLDKNQQEVLRHLVEAARRMSPIYLRQAWHENLAVAATLTGAEAVLFQIHAGLWDRLDGEPFVGDAPRPETAGFYPPDMTRDEFETFLENQPSEQRKAFEGLFTMIVRTEEGLQAIPYSEFFAHHLRPAATHLQEAAAITENESLRRFLESRAAAFLSDDYYQSDMDWMDLDSQVEITIGPYETYEDRMFGYKAAFEAFVTVADQAESERLAIYKSELPAMEANLPIPQEMKNPNRGTESPIRVVDVVYTAGDTRAGVQTIAFNLPNDERVREIKGSKKVLLRNVIKAKYEGILGPIAELMVDPDQVKLVSADSFTNHTLFHEMSHGLGPGRIKVNGRDTEVRLELKDLYSPLEEAKADIMGVYNQLFMIEKGVMPDSIKQNLFPTWLAGLFRSIRFGVEEAHGKANMIQFNYMLKRGAVARDPATGLYRILFDEFEAGTRDLVREICVLQANGDYQGTLEFFQTYGELGDELKDDLKRLEKIPVDIRPVYAPDSGSW